MLFYDGLSDVLSSHMNGAAGISQNEPRRRREFDLPERPQQMLWAFGQWFPAREFWGFHRLVTNLRRGIRSPADNRSQTPPLRDEVARKTLHIYTANLAFVEALGQPYGFETLFYWQPNIFSKRRRSPSEQAAAEHLLSTERAFVAIYRGVRQSAALNDRPRFHDISALLDDLEAPYYVDGTHLSEAGNRLVAEAMVEDVIALIEQRRSAAEGNKATE